MKVLCVAAALCVALFSLPCAATAEEPAVRVSSSASAAILYEPTSGRVLFEKNAHTKRPMASTTKLMTALVAVEALPADAVLTASAEALAVEGSSMGLAVGDTITRDDLLAGLLLSSGNDAANVFALSIAGSYQAFAAMMNEKAASLGMQHSQFVTPSGLDADGHGASAYDMALLAAAVLENECLRTICATAQQTITVGDRTVTLTNHNRLLSMYEGAIGMKTGYTSLAGRCLVSAATRDGVTLIAVTLNCGNDWEEHITLLDEGFALLEEVTLSAPPLLPLTVYGGERAQVALSVPPVTVTVMRGDATAIETVVTLPPYRWAPVRQGETVGKVTYRLRGMALAEVPITACEAAEMQAPLSFGARVGQLFWRLLEALTTS